MRYIPSVQIMKLFQCNEKSSISDFLYSFAGLFMRGERKRSNEAYG
jgi:hypothetical protein